MATEKKTFRLDETTVQALEKMASQLGVSQTEALRRAIRETADRLDDSSTDASQDGQAASVLVAQLEVKDRQIEKLQQLLDQEQRLQMAASQKLLEEPRRSWLKRLFGGDD